jgi:hypothetical protein
MATNKTSKYFFRRPLLSDRAANITMASNGDMIFLSTWDTLPNGKSGRVKDRSIFFNLERWKTLCYYFEEVNQWVSKVQRDEHVEMKLHLGGNLHASVSSVYERVDIRFWYVPEKQTMLRAGKPGIALTFDEWFNLQTIAEELNSILKIDTIDACLVDLVHQSENSAMRCPECHPSDRYERGNCDQSVESKMPQSKEPTDPDNQAASKNYAATSHQRVKPYYNPRDSQRSEGYAPGSRYNETKSFYGY